MAAALWAINQAACGSSGEGSAPAAGGCYRVDEGMLEDQDRARELLSGDELIFDVQTHVSDPLVPFETDDPPERALDFIKQIFVQSDTTVACVTGIPAARRLGAGGVTASTQLSELIDRRWGPRLILHANADPENGAAELDYMQAVAELNPVAAWKVYPHSGALRLDSDELGSPFFERARRLDVRIVAAHRGLSGGGGYEAAGSPVDVVRAAAAAPDIAFLVYHSGWESSTDEDHPYQPDAGDPRGVDRFVRALLETGIGPGGNVYAELGSTWFNLMGEPEQAAHVLGKLLLHLGPERVLWGTDSVFNGTPQAQIAALRSFEIPVALQERSGYPALTDAVRARIFGLNATAVYGVDPEALRYAIAGDEVDCLKLARAADPRAVPLPDARRYEGPRTRRQLLALLEREQRDRVLCRSGFRG
jgi:predicted TIM-barrel fold metal-dependent hydrolase